MNIARHDELLLSIVILSESGGRVYRHCADLDNQPRDKIKRFRPCRGGRNSLCEPTVGKDALQCLAILILRRDQPFREIRKEGDHARIKLVFNLLDVRGRFVRGFNRGRDYPQFVGRHIQHFDDELGGLSLPMTSFADRKQNTTAKIEPPFRERGGVASSLNLLNHSLYCKSMKCVSEFLILPRLLDYSVSRTKSNLRRGACRIRQKNGLRFDQPLAIVNSGFRGAPPEASLKCRQLTRKILDIHVGREKFSCFHDNELHAVFGGIF